MTDARLDLFAYQAQAADIMAGRERYGLHDEMGIGKTATTIGAIDRINGVRGIIVCPGMLRENWIKEFRKFGQRQLRLCKGQNIHDFVAWSRYKYDVLITSYELATKWVPDFRKRGEVIDFIAFDEAHYMKNCDAARTKAMLGIEACGDDSLVEWAVQAWHVTGTLMANDPMDVYTFLRFAKAIAMTPNQFARKYFYAAPGTYGVRYTVRPEMLEELKHLIACHSIRRTHKDVGMQLPPIWLKEVLIDGDTQEITSYIKEHPGIEHAIIEAIELGGLSNLDAEYIATLRRLVAKAKAIPYVQMLKWEMDSGASKRVIFGIHTEPLKYIQAHMLKSGYDFVLVNGETPEWERQDAVRRFMEDPKCMGFIGNIRVAGVGLTLTESSEIDMFESDWSPAGNAQAIKRIHRYGQRRDVTARFITLARTIDEAVNKIVAGKTAAIAQVDGSAMTAAPA